MSIGFVVIGRNEGERLKRCLQSVIGAAGPVIYVDSGSTDGSAETARALGASVVNLDLSIPFSAARARNEGFKRLIETAPESAYVQFVDGDCELISGWLAAATAALLEQPDVVIVAGKLSERFPQASIYNRLGELEWNFAGTGEVSAVGGIFMIRRQAFEDAGGFDATVMAGEEPELCRRLRIGGWHLLRLDDDMAWHDLGMTRFGQWWWRQVRGGYGGLDVVWRFGLEDYKRNNWRARFWSFWPVLILLSGSLAGLLAALPVALLWPAQFARIALNTWRGGQPPRVSLAYAFFTMLSFWPQMLGQARYLMDRLQSRAPRLIEYKTALQPIRQAGAANLDSVRSQTP